MSLDNNVSANAPALTLAERLRLTLSELGLAPCDQISGCQLSPQLRVVSTLNGMGRLRADRNRRRPLAELDRIFHELAGQAPPEQLLPERIEAHGTWTRRPCVTTFFVVVALRGGGDVLLIVRDPSLLARANEELAHAHEHTTPLPAANAR